MTECLKMSITQSQFTTIGIEPLESNHWNRTIGIEPLGSKAPIKIADKETSTQLTVNYIQ